MTRRATLTAFAVAAAVLYGVLWLGYSQSWGWLRSVDWPLLNAAHDIGLKHPAWVWFWDGVSFVLGPNPLRLVGMLGAVALVVKRNVRAALLLLMCLPLAGLVTAAAKGLAGRPRPATALVVVGETSFPSGHALEAMAGALALLTVTLPLLSRSGRRVAVGAAALCVLTVGTARVALNVHHPSDVLAGWALGYLYFLLCLLVIRPTVWSRRGDPTGAEPLLDPAVRGTGP